MAAIDPHSTSSPGLSRRPILPAHVTSTGAAEAWITGTSPVMTVVGMGSMADLGASRKEI